MIFIKAQNPKTPKPHSNKNNYKIWIKVIVEKATLDISCALIKIMNAMNYFYYPFYQRFAS
jgi:hypothetical protein